MKQFFESPLRVWLRNMFLLYGLAKAQQDDFTRAALESALRYSGSRLIRDAIKEDKDEAEQHDHVE